jgi:hypothetical protein
MTRHHLTTEWLRKQFHNNFDLCNFSINIAQNLIAGNGTTQVDEILETVEDRIQEGK